MSAAHPLFDPESAFANVLMQNPAERNNAAYFQQLARMDGARYSPRVPKPLILQSSDPAEHVKGTVEQKQQGGQQKFRITIKELKAVGTPKEFCLFLIPPEQLHGIADTMMMFGKDEEALRSVFSPSFLTDNSGQRQNAFNVLVTLPRLLGKLNAEGEGEVKHQLPANIPPLNCPYMVAVLNS